MPPSYDAGGSRSSLYYARLSRSRWNSAIAGKGPGPKAPQDCRRRRCESQAGKGVSCSLPVAAELCGQVPAEDELERRAQLRMPAEKAVQVIGRPRHEAGRLDDLDGGGRTRAGKEAHLPCELAKL